MSTNEAKNTGKERRQSLKTQINEKEKTQINEKNITMRSETRPSPPVTRLVLFFAGVAVCSMIDVSRRWTAEGRYKRRDGR